VDGPTDVKQNAATGDYLAAERTFLAWVRTGLALMGFGFVVARFGLFLQQVEIFRGTSVESSSGLSLWFGTALIAVGVIVHLSSALRFARLVRELDRGELRRCRSLTQTVSVASFLGLVGLAMAIYLVSIRNAPSMQPEERQTTMTSLPSNGIIDKPSNDLGRQDCGKAQEHSASKGKHVIRPRRP
jgi:putative membrane protein